MAAFINSVCIFFLSLLFALLFTPSFLAGPYGVVTAELTEEDENVTIIFDGFYMSSKQGKSSFCISTPSKISPEVSSSSDFSRL